QPALFVVEYSLAQLWMSWGLRPSALIGHSIGEYVAACVAGVFSLEDALRLVVVRGRLMQQMPAGTMLVAPLPESDVTPLLNSRLSLASINNPSLCVVAGPAADVHEFEAKLAEQAIVTIRLHTSHAFHSWMMGEALEPFRTELLKAKLNAPKLPFISNVTGNWITADEATDPDYWVKQLRLTVRLSDGLEQLFRKNMLLVEVGPGQTLTNNASTHPAKPAEQVVMASLPHAKQRDEDLTLMLTSLGRLWLAGVAIDWEAFYANERRRRMELPSYPFERERYWIDGAHKRKQVRQEEPETALVPVTTETQPEPSSNGNHKRPRLSTEYEAPANDLEKTIAQIWHELLGIQDIGIYDNFFELGGHSLLGTMLLTRLRKMFQVDLALATLFQAPTIAEIALAIEERLIQEVVDLQPA
ncbi:MAG TPA: acyltransferase domain-containing protein, partial [Pyrinomonadaceae bacterium]|nr:acyltransferase domain-containing protein [Pyrinomonadaceae bacterium]